MTSDAYTVSKMLQSINAVMAPVATMPHATVSLKRTLDNGVMLDTSPQEVALLDLQARVKHAAQQVMAIKQRGGDQDQWVAEKRQCGNDAFREGFFQQAAELYVEALAGLDFGKTPEQRRACELQTQVPLTCNLVSCLLMMEQWEKAKQVCGQALQLDPTCVRALSQRAKALTRLARFEDARRDLRQAIDTLVARDSGPSRSESGGDEPRLPTLEKLRQQMETTDRAERRERACIQKQREFQQQMMREAVGRLYEDKAVVPTAKPAEAASSERLIVHETTWQASLVRWLASMLLVVLRFLFGSSEKRE